MNNFIALLSNIRGHQATPKRPQIASSRVSPGAFDNSAITQTCNKNFSRRMIGAKAYHT